MYKVTVHDYFSSAHQLNGYAGKCEDLHGHNWKVVVDIEGEQLDKVGLLIDFKIVKKILNEILDQLDHKFLNDIEELKNINPSSENLSQYVYAKMKAKLPEGVRLSAVTIWESENSRATYYE
jgi:6-pyruvoyltetrahydropterin/6-carboxytetrahydropterin synthase